MVTPLDRKLLRDLLALRGQVLAIAVVIGAGIALFVLMFSTFQSLDETQRVYYQEQQFADVFASLKRAPQRTARRIAAIPGVAQVETRVVVPATIDVSGFQEPISGQILSIPLPRQPVLNDILIERGRYPEAGHPDEVLVSRSFSAAHRLSPGDSVAAVINGRHRQLQITGVALSPEFVYQIRPGEMIPDDSRFGVFWMERRELASAFDMEGGFNDVLLTLMHGADEAEVIRQLDDILEGFGGRGALPRHLQASHFYLQSELDALRGIGAFLPLVFLALAAFLLNVVLTRIVALQRTQIAALKALGYTNLSIASHYIKWALLVGLLGGVLGVIAGAWMGAGMTEMYTQFFHFPILVFDLDPRLIVMGLAVSLIAAVLGATLAVRSAVQLPPAEAMRPAAPTRFGKSLLERLGLGRWLSQPARMIARNMQRQPTRTLVSIMGISSGAALMVAGNFSFDGVERLMDLQFNRQQRFDIQVSFVEPMSRDALFELQGFEGVLHAEPFRSTPIRLKNQNHSRYGAIIGVEPSSELFQLVDPSGEATRLPPQGLILSSKLAEILQVEVDDNVRIEVLEGARPVWQLPVASVVEEYMGTNAYLDAASLHRLLREGESLSGAYLRIDPNESDQLFAKLKSTPGIAGVYLKSAALNSFDETMSAMIGKIRFVNVLFAALITLGVVYNTAPVSLSERSRELASLRVVGFRRAEISYVLLGELAIVTLIAVPVGLFLGYQLSALTVHAYDTEVYRLPLVISSRTYAYAAITVLVSAALSGLIVRRKLDRLDLIGVLKSRE